jgi:hypothetical protein
VLVVPVVPAQALEGNGGVSVGGILAGSRPHLAVSPHGAIGLRSEGGFAFALEDTLGILLATNKDGVGLHNRIALQPGYAGEKIAFSAGPSVSFFSMAVCNPAAQCGRASGVSLGLHAQASYYFFGPLGVSLAASADWIAGNNLLLPQGVAAMVVVGPVLRWTAR